MFKPYQISFNPNSYKKVKIINSIFIEAAYSNNNVEDSIINYTQFEEKW